MLSLDLWSKWVLELKSLELTDTYGCLGYPSSRRTTFFQFSDKKAICLTRKQIKILGIPRNRELNWTFLSILSKIIFFYFKVTIILFNFILQSWGSMILLSRNLYLFFQVTLCPSLTKQQLFCITESSIGQEP